MTRLWSDVGFVCYCIMSRGWTGRLALTGHQLPSCSLTTNNFHNDHRRHGATGAGAGAVSGVRATSTTSHHTQMLAFNPGHQKTIVPDVSWPAGPTHQHHHGDGHFSAPPPPSLSGDSWWHLHLQTSPSTKCTAYSKSKLLYWTITTSINQFQANMNTTRQVGQPSTWLRPDDHILSAPNIFDPTNNKYFNLAFAARHQPRWLLMLEKWNDKTLKTCASFHISSTLNRLYMPPRPAARHPINTLVEVNQAILDSSFKLSSLEFSKVNQRYIYYICNVKSSSFYRLPSSKWSVSKKL